MHQNYNGYGGQSFGTPLGSDLGNFFDKPMFDAFKKEENRSDEWWAKQITFEGQTAPSKGDKAAKTAADILKFGSGIAEATAPYWFDAAWDAVGGRKQQQQQAAPPPPPPAPGLPPWAKVLGGVLITGAVLGGGVLLWHRQKLNDQ